VKGGTSSLHLIIHVLGIGPGDEVITTPFSFNASTNCILMEGAVSVFADIDPVTLCIDPDEFDNGRTPACRVAGQTGLRLPVQSWQTVSKDRQAQRKVSDLLPRRREATMRMGIGGIYWLCDLS